jgi:hypothetical protein
MSDTKKEIDGYSSDAEVEELRARIEELEEDLSLFREAAETLASDGEDLDLESVDENGDGSNVPISRRGALAAMGAAGLIGAGALTGTAGAAVGDTLHYGDTVTGNPSDHALRLETSSGHGMIGRTVGTDPGSSGVLGISAAPKGYGLHGRATNQSGSNYGLWGLSMSSNGVGMYGKANAESGSTIGVRGVANSPDGYGLTGTNYATSGTTYGVRGRVASDDGYGLHTPDDALVEGDLHVQGTKNFVQSVDSPSGPKQVAYTAIEAGKALTEVSDVAELSDGRAEIELPDHFEWVTSEEEELAVQVTPYATEAAKPQVVHQSTDRIVVEDFAEEAPDYTFAYTVKGVREGFEDATVVHD